MEPNPTESSGSRTDKWLTPSVRGGLQVTIQVLLSAALFAVLQVLASAHNVRFDLTPTQEYVLADASRRVAASLEEQVRVTVFFNSQETERRRDIADLLDQYRAVSKRLSYRFVDLDRAPGLARKYGIASYFTGVMESGGRVVELKNLDEQEMTNSLLKLFRDETRNICFLTGHGERSPESTAERDSYSEVAKALESENFAIRTLGTVPMDGPPGDCWIVVLAGPSHELLPGEGILLESYVRGGGRLMVLVDQDAPASVISLLSAFGVEVGDDVVVDQQNRFFGSDSFTARVPIFDQNSFGNRLETAAVFPLARSLRPIDDFAGEGIQVSPLAMSSPDSWALVGVEELPEEGDVRFRKDIDEPGPIPVGVLVTVDLGAGAQDAAEMGRVAVFGDSDFATNFYLNLLGNKDLIMSAVALLAEEPELIAVRRKGAMRGSLPQISLTARQGRIVFWIAVVVLPTLFILAGLVAVFVRRRRRGGR